MSVLEDGFPKRTFFAHQDKNRLPAPGTEQCKKCRFEGNESVCEQKEIVA